MVKIIMEQKKNKFFIFFYLGFLSTVYFRFVLYYLNYDLYFRFFVPVLPNLEIIIGLIFVIAQYFIFLYSLYFLFLIKAEKEMDFSTFFKNIFTSMLKGFFYLYYLIR